MRLAVALLGVLLPLVSSVHAGPILGIEIAQHFGFGNSLRDDTAIDAYVRIGNGHWMIPSLDTTDIGKTFVASADTTADYPRLDWSRLDLRMRGGGASRQWLEWAFGGSGQGQSVGWDARIPELHLLNHPLNRFTEPNIYFESLDRIEYELVALVFTPGQLFDVTGDVVIRFYGEGTNVPEPSACLLWLVGFGALASRRTR